MGLIREDEADIRVSVNGKPYFDNWASYDGGVLKASSNKTRVGGQNEEVEAGGPASRDDITCTIQFDDVVAGFHNELENLSASGGQAAVSIQWLNPDRTAIPGAHFTRRGVLLSAELPKGDRNGNAVGMYTITIGAHQKAG